MLQQPPSFSFIIHPRTFEDYFRWEIGKYIFRQTTSDEEFLRLMRSANPAVVGSLCFKKTKIWGELITVPLLPTEIHSSKGLKLIKKATTMAIESGVSVIGLGGLISPASGAGAKILHLLPENVTLTTGNAFTAGVIEENIKEASRYLGLKKLPVISIIGCTGSVGAPLSRILAKQGYPLILIGRTEKRVRTLFKDLAGTVKCTGAIETINEGDITIVLSNDPSAKIDQSFAKPGSLIIDCTEPKNITEETKVILEARGVSVLDGGLVNIPDSKCSFDFGFTKSTGVFACLAETYLFAVEGIKNHSIGRASPELTKKIKQAALRMGITPCALFQHDYSTLFNNSILLDT